jgi:hypothetical protein
MSKSWRALVVRMCAISSILLTVVIAGGQQAYAASNVMKDTRNDTNAPAAKHPDHLVLKPSANGDITSVRTVHSAKAVDVVVHMRKLARGSRLAMLDIRTSAKHHSRFVVTLASLKGQKVLGLTQGLNTEVRCRGLRGAFDVAGASVHVHVPRSCIGNPEWVRTGAVVMTSLNLKTGLPASVDAAGRKVLTDRWWNADDLHLPHGPRVHVG